MSVRLPKCALTLCAAALLLVTAAPARSGDLNPPAGPPGDTYPTLGFKTLQQVEPRTPVDKLPGSATAVYEIIESGSYYLTANVVGESGKHGIAISADNVTLDLNGFALLGTFDALAGVYVTDPGFDVRRNIAVVNGSARDWGWAGVDLGWASTSRVERVRSSYNSGAGIAMNYNSGVADCNAELNSLAGISVGNVCTITRCTALYNGDAGIRAGAEASISNCTAETNYYAGIAVGVTSSLINCVARNNYVGKGSAAGFQLDDGCTVVGCSADLNTGAGFYGYSGCTITGCSSRSNFGVGIELFDDANVTNCSVTQNSYIGIYVSGGTVTNSTASRNGYRGISSFFQVLNVVNCDASHNGGEGVYLDTGGRVEGCTAHDNGEEGIEVVSDSVLLHNSCTANGWAFASAGIFATGERNRIDGNTATNQARGIDVDMAGNLVIRNSASGNTTNYDISVGNVVGPIVNAGNVATSSNPHANYEY